MNNFDPKKTRHVVLVENEPLMRDLLARAIESAGFRVTTAANAADAKRALISVDPDAFVLDIELGPGPNGFDFAEVVMKKSPSTGIVFLTNLPDPRFGGKAQNVVKKNQAYLRKSEIYSGEELVLALEAVLRDQVTKEYRHDLVSNDSISSLSARQIQTLQLVSEGRTNTQIAKVRGISVRAVESMLSRIFGILEIDPNSSNPRVEASSRFHQLRSQIE
ncbi:response regulator transcription factor [Candidatus Aquiluna sp. UB-MaderosW2red]|uniref:response regulator transcription factor n=1 Tax=Candidatus Aquiluna sp. UB-MaderosW2red TaxID=1855377 RepID=UPI000875B3CD|nr:response regulator transcription factor [Candidatus Aquiluna sp. UB-MaderosW2red]SCX15527.1 DNA-binding response regulator, NarL/FixJ family, contains REC and HTH domains [Candidatus Aquiluna sp. UB-MaderosW2red]